MEIMSNKCMKVHGLLETREVQFLTHIYTNENITHTYTNGRTRILDRSTTRSTRLESHLKHQARSTQVRDRSTRYGNSLVTRESSPNIIVNIGFWCDSAFPCVCVVFDLAVHFMGIAQAELFFNTFVLRWTTRYQCVQT